MKKPGFTIIEFLLYLAILSVGLVLLSSFINLINGVRAKNALITEVEQLGNDASYIIRQAIIDSTGINYPTPGSSGSSLSLSFSDSNKNPTIFSLNSGRIIMQAGSNAPVEITNSRVRTTDIIFYNLAQPATPGSISGRFRLESLYTGNRSELNYTKTFNMSASRRL